MTAGWSCRFGGGLAHARLLLLLGLPAGGLACSTFLVGKEATTDGSVLVSHSDDAEGNDDSRIIRVPAADYEEGAMRPVFYDTEDYPRYVGRLRGPDYFPEPGQKDYEPIGHIPQVRHTFAYWDTTYGVMNENHVAIGESTCSGAFAALAVGHGGKALLSVDELSKIAMERANSSREAVELMGALAVHYGFYGADGGLEGGSESLLVADKEEGWIFHIMPDETGTSAIWVAQRVPDDHATVVMNMFVIRHVDLEDKDNFLGSPNMFSIAQSKGWWKPGEEFDFTKIYSLGEYVHKYYSGRRVWRGLSLMAPSLGLNASYGNLRYEAAYPVTVKPDRKLSAQDIMHFHRDYYEGTPYDTTKGLAAGAFGNPDRYKVQAAVKGAWERTIALYRTGFTVVSQVGGELAGDIGGVTWFGSASARYTVFLPLPIQMNHSAKACSVGGPRDYGKMTHFWAVRKIGNLARLRYADMVKDIDAKQGLLEQEGLKLVREYVGKASSAVELTEAFDGFAARAVQEWLDLGDYLLWKYADGFSNDPSTATPLGYSEEWLRKVGYPDGPPPPPEVEVQQPGVYV